MWAFLFLVDVDIVHYTIHLIILICIRYSKAAGLHPVKKVSTIAALVSLCFLSGRHGWGSSGLPVLAVIADTLLVFKAPWPMMNSLFHGLLEIRSSCGLHFAAINLVSESTIPNLANWKCSQWKCFKKGYKIGSFMSRVSRLLKRFLFLFHHTCAVKKKPNCSTCSTKYIAVVDQAR